MTRGVVTDDSVTTGGLTELEIIVSLEVIVSLVKEEGEKVAIDVTSSGKGDGVEVEVTLPMELLLVVLTKLAVATKVGGSAILYEWRVSADSFVSEQLLLSSSSSSLSPDSLSS